MKKGLFLLSFLLLPVLTFSGELKFVTVLSSPVGTFNRLEEVDPTVPVKSPVINFCTKLGNSGTVTLQGNKNPEVNTLSLSNGTVLGGSGKDYVLNKLTMKQGGTLKGSRLLANVMQVANGGMGKSENLYSNSLTVAGAKTGKLYVNGSDAVIEEAWPADVTMVWSNEYQTDNACKDGNKCAGQYLLKQQGSSSDPCAGEKVKTHWNGSACVCPSSKTYWAAANACCSLTDTDTEKQEPCWRKSTVTDCSEKWVMENENAQINFRCKSQGYTVECQPVSPLNSSKYVPCNNAFSLDMIRLGDLQIASAGFFCKATIGDACSRSHGDGFCVVSGSIWQVTGGGSSCVYNSNFMTSGTVGYQVLACKQECTESEQWKPQWPQGN